MGNLIASLAFVVFVAAVLAIAFALEGARQKRMAVLISNWATGGGFQIVVCEKQWFCMGPYWIKRKDQTIYHVIVVDRLRRRRSAWLRCDGGFWSDHVDVEWDN